MGPSRGEGVGGAQEGPPARGKFSKTGSKTGPPGAFSANCEGWRWTLDFSFVYCNKIFASEHNLKLLSLYT